MVQLNWNQLILMATSSLPIPDISFLIWTNGKNAEADMKWKIWVSVIFCAGTHFTEIGVVKSLKVPAAGSGIRRLLKKKLGEFAGDSAQVGVFLLREILRYNPQWNYHIEKPWCACLIKNFTGTVKIVVKLDPDGDESMHLIGIGTQSFFTREAFWSEVFP